MAARLGSIYIALDVDVGRLSRFRDAANTVERDSTRLRTALGGTSQSVNTLRDALSRNFRMRIASESLRTLTTTTNEVERLRAALLGLSALTGTGITAAFAGTYLLQTADKAKRITNDLRTVSSSEENLYSIRKKLYDVSQDTRSSFDATVRLYARTARAADALGLSQQNLLRITKTVQEAFAVGGATQQEATGGAIQLSQAIAANRFSGNDFRYVSEDAPVLMRAMAHAMGVDIGQLKLMGQQGLLTTQEVTSAIIRASQEVDDAFQKTNVTLGQSITRLDNAFLMWVGDVDSSYGVTRKLAAVLSNLSANFGDVAHYATLAVGAGGAFFAGRSLASFANNKVSNYQASAKARQQEIDGLTEELRLIERRREELRQEKRDVGTQSRQSLTGLDMNRANQTHSAREKEYAASEQVKALENERALAQDKLTIARQAAVADLQREVELDRELVRDNASRVAAAQTLALEEERILRAKQAQKIAQANQVVAGKQANLGTANSRAADAEAAVAKERELQRAKLRSQIEERQRRIVTQTMSLQGTQGRLSDLRSISNLGDFNEVYGKEYTGLLQKQQSAMIATQKLRGEISGLEEQLAKLDAGESTGRGLTSAMNKHAAAVKKVQAAVDALAVAEKKRDEIANAPVSGASLKQRLAAEQRELDRYEKSVAKLKTDMDALSEATTGAFQSKAAQKYASDVEKLSGKLSTAQANLRTASEAVAAAEVTDSKSVAAAMKIRGEAIAEVNQLQAESNALAERGAVVAEKLSIAQKAASIGSIARRAGAGVLGFLGGWTGVGFIAAIAGIGLYEQHVARAAEQTANINKEMENLGYLSTTAADGLSGAAKSLDDLTSDQLRQKLRELNEEMKKSTSKQNIFDWLFNFNSDSLGNIEAQLKAATIKAPAPTSYFLNDRQLALQASQASAPDRQAANDMLQLIQDAKSGQTPAKELLARLDEIAKLPLSAHMDDLVESLRKAIPHMKALEQYASDTKKQLNDIKTPFWLQQTIQDYNSTKEAEANYQKGQHFLKTRTAQLDVNPVQKAIDTIAKQIIAAAKKSNIKMSETIAKQQAMLEYEVKQARTGLLGLIGYSEGTDSHHGYNETLGYGRFTGGPVTLTNMTLNQILELQKGMLAQTKELPKSSPYYDSSAVGRYQFTRTTLERLMQTLGISGTEYFSKQMQDRLAEELIRETGGSIGKLRSIWVSLQKVPDHIVAAAYSNGAKGMAPVDSNTKKFIDSMRNLDLKNQTADLDAFSQEVIKTAQSMGASNEEIHQFIAALSSGDFSKVPERFKGLAQQLESIGDAGALAKLKQLNLSEPTKFFSDLDQSVIQTAHSFGVAQPEIQSYIDALTKGDITKISPTMAAIRAEIEKTTNDQKIVKFTDGIAESVGQLATSFLDGQGNIQGFLKSLVDLAAQFLVIQPLIDTLKTSLRGFDSSISNGGASTGYAPTNFLENLFGAVFGGGSGSGSNYFPPAPTGGAPSSGLGLYAGGGRVTGPGSGTSDSIPARLSNGEYVVRAAAARHAGPLLDAINSGKMTALAAGGWAQDVATASPSLPQAPEPSGDGSKVNVNIAPPAGYQADTQKTPDGHGGMNVDVVFRQMRGMLAKDIAEGGQTAQIIGSRFGIKMQPGS